MDDIREEIVDDRGAIKKLQLLFPGYHGYRVNEDLRDADIYLKNELYKKMLNIIENLKLAEQALVSNGIFRDLERIGIVRSRIQALAGEIRHHEAGYSGISPPVRIGKDKISALYDLDMKIYDDIVKLDEGVKNFKDSCSSGNYDFSILSSIDVTINDLMSLNSSRDRLLYGGV
ncbi:MAG: hypothetical protein ACP5LL_04435 [Thermoplasmata archaeon]|jgi:hypothetical protein